MRENLRYILTLTLICFVTASLLTGVYLLTRPRILEQKERIEKEALVEVMPEAEYFEPVVKDDITYFRAYLSTEKKKLLGYAFRAEAQGYSSVIETMAAVDTQGEITGIKILDQNETPGLGARIEEVLVKKTLWQAMQELFSPGKRPPQLPDKSWFCSQFKGKKAEDLIVVKTPSEKNIQAVTGATISSEALTDSVRKAAEKVLEYEQQ